jgi:O-antigen/teichoic acid export membrane protein
MSGNNGTEGLNQRVQQGVVWTSSAQVGGQALHWGTVLVLAWFVTPQDFGLLGFALICITVLSALAEFGLGSALIQRSDLRPAHVAAAFWLNLVAATILGGSLWGGAHLLALFVHDDGAAGVVRALAPAIPASALLLVPRVMLGRRLNFRTLAVGDLAGEVAFAAVGIALAWRGCGVWSLAAAINARPLVRAVVLWHPWLRLPWNRFSWRDCSEVLSFSRFVMAHQLASVFIANIDYLVVGRFLGTTALGHYTLAFQLGVVPSQRLCEILGRVAFPAFAAVQRQPERLQRGFIRMISAVFVLAAPFALFTPVVSAPLVRTLYGTQWAPTGPPLQILAAMALFYAIENSGLVLTAVGRPGWEFAMTGARAGLFVVIVGAWGIHHGIIGVATSLFIAGAITAAFKIPLLGAFVHVDWRALGGAVALPLGAATVAAVFGSLIVLWQPPGDPRTLTSSLLVMTTVYALIAGRRARRVILWPQQPLKAGT